MKNKNDKSTDTEILETDDEALREAAMRDGVKKKRKWKFRPAVPGTLSIIRSNVPEKRDAAWYVAAYAFVHCAPLEEVLDADNGAEIFNRAVRRWQIANIANKAEEEELSEIVHADYERVDAAETKAKHPAPAGGTDSGK
jgi:hypothetical protein